MRSGRVLVAVSPFASGPEAGHSVDDDEFYFNYLIDRNRAFVYYTPRYSAERLARLHPGFEDKIKVLPDPDARWRANLALACGVDIPDQCQLLFFGYSEKLVTAFFASKPLCGFRLTLVATNNFSARRVRLYGVLLRAFLLAVRPRLRRLIVHTDFERAVAERLGAPFRLPVVVKKHHLMISNTQVRSRPASAGRPVIAFFGPGKAEKPIDPLLDLIRADTGARFDYRLYGLGPADVRKMRNVVDDYPHINITTEMLPRNTYLAEFSRASLVLLSHTREFEGKLSGNLCDCIANEVPFIGNRIEPYLEYEKRYGPLGFLEDMEDADWAKRFLRAVNENGLERCRRNLRVAASDFTLESVRASLDACL
jgi:hypothetical protein